MVTIENFWQYFVDVNWDCVLYSTRLEQALSILCDIELSIFSQRTHTELKVQFSGSGRSAADVERELGSNAFFNAIMQSIGLLESASWPVVMSVIWEAMLLSNAEKVSSLARVEVGLPVSSGGHEGHEQRKALRRNLLMLTSTSRGL